MKLSKNFTLKEFTRSQTATRLGLDNTPNEEHLENAKALFENVVQKIRDEHGVTRINSGYRGPELNKAVGGSPNSQHCHGEAADLECDGIDNLELAKWIRDNLQFDQLILEFYTPGDPSSGWIHITWKRNISDNRNKTLTASRVDGKTQYSLGLPDDSGSTGPYDF
tara:strand:+ start:237 stop:734 length:498 start_codon:yes stop_codon:yes gene_type:complete